MEADAEIAALLRRTFLDHGLKFSPDTVINGVRGIHDEEAAELVLETGRRLGLTPDAFDDFPFATYFGSYEPVGAGLLVALWHGLAGLARRLSGGERPPSPAPQTAKLPLTVASFTALMLSRRDAYQAARAALLQDASPPRQE
ncbi:hypothetical protein [Plastoroseomonas arctica]|uniref:Uncharacterized protein n=1 Tax=Plastoroseomonas arctica TaxID=1509237 RepID=A0AAF1K611_9PROT|nr:hypothetical protein [Plastoroseomonas arctica]MBR0657155.1 hypothetical protein [Plastoroseomonas arctica]